MYLTGKFISPKLYRKHKLWEENKLAEPYEPERKLKLDDRDELDYDRQQEVSNFSNHVREAKNNVYDYVPQEQNNYGHEEYNPDEGNVSC